ncbi:MAG: hypothetical protein R3327_05025 [Nitrosopumilaceae archaeon]|nr:hypothetical protein [Nitrosopumilaceae archaeon]
MKNQDIVGNILMEVGKEITKILPSYKVVFQDPVSNYNDKQVSVFLYDIERIVTLDYSLYHSGNRKIPLDSIPVDIKFLLTVFGNDHSQSSKSLIHLYSRLHKTYFFKYKHKKFGPPKIILESKGPEIWSKLFPQTNYMPSVPIIVSGVILSIDDST